MSLHLKEVNEGFGREYLKTSHPLGPLVAELQDYVEILYDNYDENVDIAANTAAIDVLEGQVQTAVTGLLDRATALETDVGTLQTEVETTTTGLLDRTTALETAKTTDEANITQLQGAGVLCVPVSFETGETGSHTVYFPAKVTIDKVRLFVSKALADTDDGTVQLQNAAATNMANGLGTLTASSAFGVEVTITPTTNNVVTADSHIHMVTAKTTAGGKALAFIEYTVTP